MEERVGMDMVATVVVGVSVGLILFVLTQWFLDQP